MYEKTIEPLNQFTHRFLDRTERTSWVNLNASSKGSKDNRETSIGSENQDFIGIALLGKHL